MECTRPLNSLALQFQSRGDRGDLILVFHVADQNLAIGQQFCQRFAPLLAVHDVNHRGSALLQQAGDMPGHAFAIGHTKNQKPLALALAESSSRSPWDAGAGPRGRRTDEFQRGGQLAG